MAGPDRPFPSTSKKRSESDLFPAVTPTKRFKRSGSKLGSISTGKQAENASNDLRIVGAAEEPGTSSPHNDDLIIRQSSDLIAKPAPDLFSPDRDRNKNRTQSHNMLASSSTSRTSARNSISRSSSNNNASGTSQPRVGVKSDRIVLECGSDSTSKAIVAGAKNDSHHRARQSFETIFRFQRILFENLTEAQTAYNYQKSRHRSAAEALKEADGHSIHLPTYYQLPLSSRPVSEKQLIVAESELEKAVRKCRLFEADVAECFPSLIRICGFGAPTGPEIDDLFKHIRRFELETDDMAESYHDIKFARMQKMLCGLDSRVLELETSTVRISVPTVEFDDQTEDGEGEYEKPAVRDLVSALEDRVEAVEKLKSRIEEVEDVKQKVESMESISYNVESIDDVKAKVDSLDLFLFPSGKEDVSTPDTSTTSIGTPSTMVAKVTAGTSKSIDDFVDRRYREMAKKWGLVLAGKTTALEQKVEKAILEKTAALKTQMEEQVAEKIAALESKFEKTIAAKTAELESKFERAITTKLEVHGTRSGQRVAEKVSEMDNRHLRSMSLKTAEMEARFDKRLTDQILADHNRLRRHYDTRLDEITEASKRALEAAGSPASIKADEVAVSVAAQTARVDALKQTVSSHTIKFLQIAQSLSTLTRKLDDFSNRSPVPDASVPAAATTDERVASIQTKTDQLVGRVNDVVEAVNTSVAQVRGVDSQVASVIRSSNQALERIATLEQYRSKPAEIESALQRIGAAVAQSQQEVFDRIASMEMRTGDQTTRLRQVVETGSRDAEALSARLSRLEDSSATSSSLFVGQPAQEAGCSESTRIDSLEQSFAAHQQTVSDIRESVSIWHSKMRALESFNSGRESATPSPAQTGGSNGNMGLNSDKVELLIHRKVDDLRQESRDRLDMLKESLSRNQTQFDSTATAVDELAGTAGRIDNAVAKLTADLEIHASMIASLKEMVTGRSPGGGHGNRAPQPIRQTTWTAAGFFPPTSSPTNMAGVPVAAHGGQPAGNYMTQSVASQQMVASPPISAGFAVGHNVSHNTSHALVPSQHSTSVGHGHGNSHGFSHGQHMQPPASSPVQPSVGATTVAMQLQSQVAQLYNLLSSLRNDVTGLQRADSERKQQVQLAVSSASSIENRVASINVTEIERAVRKILLEDLKKHYASIHSKMEGHAHQIMTIQKAVRSASMSGPSGSVPATPIPVARTGSMSLGHASTPITISDTGMTSSSASGSVAMPLASPMIIPDVIAKALSDLRTDMDKAVARMDPPKGLAHSLLSAPMHRRFDALCDQVDMANVGLNGLQQEVEKLKTAVTTHSNKHESNTSLLDDISIQIHDARTMIDRLQKTQLATTNTTAGSSSDGMLDRDRDRDKDREGKLMGAVEKVNSRMSGLQALVDELEKRCSDEFEHVDHHLQFYMGAQQVLQSIVYDQLGLESTDWKGMYDDFVAQRTASRDMDNPATESDGEDVAPIRNRAGQASTGAGAAGLSASSVSVIRRRGRARMVDSDDDDVDAVGWNYRDRDGNGAAPAGDDNMSSDGPRSQPSMLPSR